MLVWNCLFIRPVQLFSKQKPDYAYELTELGCVDISTNRQKQNGTKSWITPQNAIINTYESGYVRHISPAGWLYPINEKASANGEGWDCVLILSENERNKLVYEFVIENKEEML